LVCKVATTRLPAITRIPEVPQSIFGARLDLLDPEDASTLSSIWILLTLAKVDPRDVTCTAMPPEYALTTSAFGQDAFGLGPLCAEAAEWIATSATAGGRTEIALLMAASGCGKSFFLQQL
jgi:hypothetical protein